MAVKRAAKEGFNEAAFFRTRKGNYSDLSDDRQRDSFNEAAFFRTRKVDAPISWDHDASSFNEAAFFRTRKVKSV